MLPLPGWFHAGLLSFGTDSFH